MRPAAALLRPVTRRLVYPSRSTRLSPDGASLHLTRECYDLAVRRKAFTRALRARTGLSSAPVGDYLDSHHHQQ